jgi:hypothetical protein
MMKRSFLMAATVLGCLASTAAAPAAGQSARTQSSPEASLRVTAGQCYKPIRRRDRESLSPLVAALIRPVAGAAYDALTGALEAAGKDRETTTASVVLLERPVECIQVMSTVPGEWAADPYRAPFLLELYLRTSLDGRALAVIPTSLRYYASPASGRAGGGARHLFATVTFQWPDPARAPVSVSVPLGHITPGPGAAVQFEPAGYLDADAQNPTGSPASVWIPNPLPPAPGAAPPRAGRNVAAPADPYGGVAAAGAASSSAGAAGPRADGAPLAVLVSIREVRPGNRVARILGTGLKGAREGVLDAVDPVKVAEARKTELATWKTNMSGYADALGGYHDKLASWCATQSTANTTALMKAQVELIAAARTADQPNPVGALVTPGASRAAFCPGG